MEMSSPNLRTELRGILRLWALIIACPLALAGETVQFQPATNLLAATLPLDVGDYAIPCVTDWNGDGRPDLLVGYRYADKIAVFLNIGTGSQPVLTNSYNLQAGGADIYVAGSGCGAPAPWVCDYDRDGKRDLLVGNGSDGTVLFFANTNSNTQPILAPGVLVMVGGSPLSVGYRATPYVHDWDEDGLPDLICGNGDGSAFWYRNTSATGLPVYGNPVQIQAGGAPLSLGIRSVVRVCDWDGDGLKDLVGSSSTGVHFCRNTGNNSSPVLSAPVAIRAPVAGSGLVAINTSSRMRLDLADWNNDGVLDLLLGNADGMVVFFEGYRFEFVSIAPASGGGAEIQWRSAPYLKYDVLAGDSPEAVLNVIGTALLSGGTFTLWTNKSSLGQRFYRVRVSP